MPTYTVNLIVTSETRQRALADVEAASPQEAQHLIESGDFDGELEWGRTVSDEIQHTEIDEDYQITESR